MANANRLWSSNKFCFGGELTATQVKDSPAKDFMPAFQQEKIVNARLRTGKLAISASGWLRPDQASIRGNTVCLYLSGEHSRNCKLDLKDSQKA
jgi:uncharacterized glyoxalase superfamily protein PhnB